MASVETSYLGRLLEPVTQCFSAEVAERLISLPPDPAVQARIEDLAEKANEGQLSDVERAEYEEYIEAADLIAILQFRARAALAKHSRFLMDAAIRDLVRRRAGNRCEYCRLPQSALPHAPFHVEHVVAKQHGGSDDTVNLALACDRCNLHKGPNLSGIDTETGVTVPLFHPRKDVLGGSLSR